MDLHAKYTDKSKWGVYLKPEWFDQPSQSPDRSPTEHVSHLLQIQTEGKGPQNKQELDMAAVQAWQSVTGEHARR